MLFWELREFKALLHFFLERAQDYFCSSSGLEYVLSLCKITESPGVSQSALYTLAMATEGNGELKCMRKKIKHIHINLAGVVALCCWLFSDQVYEWVPANLMLGITLQWT